MELDHRNHQSLRVIEIVVEPGIGAKQYLYDLWLHRQVFLLISIRDTLMRYRQAFFGIAWALLRPLLVLLFFAQVFGRMHSETMQTSYYLLVLCAAPVWILFSGSVQDSIQSLVRNSNLISKIYFPRLLLVGAAISVNCVDFLIGLALALFFSLFLGEIHLDRIIFLPLAILSLLTCVLGWSIWVAALNARFRDLVNIAPFLLQVLLIASPVGYGLGTDSILTRPFYYLNPLVGIIEAMRYALSDYQTTAVFWGLFFSFIQSLVILTLGFIYFRKIEDAISDTI